MGKSSPPPPPDYAAAATAQGAANLEAAAATSAYNRPNQVDPNGTQTWTMREGADPKNPQPGDWTATTALNAQQQGLKDQQDRLSAQSATMAEGALSTIGNTMATKFDVSGLPKAAILGNSGMSAFGKVPVAQMTSQGAPGVDRNRRDLTTAGLSAFGDVAAPSEAARQSVTDALYRRSTAMLDPQTEQQSAALRSRLAAQGITEGSAAHQQAVDNQTRGQDAAYAQARDSAILAGGAEDSRIFGQDLNAARFSNDTRGQQFEERGQVASLGNANIDAIFGQGMDSAGFDRDSEQQLFMRQMQAAQQQNAMRTQQFGERQAMVATNNTLHGNAVQEALMQRELGMNEANALRTGGQVTMPNFQPYGGAGQIQAAPVMQGIADGYNAQIGGVNASNAGKAGTTAGVSSLAMAAAVAF